MLSTMLMRRTLQWLHPSVETPASQRHPSIGFPPLFRPLPNPIMRAHISNSARDIVCSKCMCYSRLPLPLRTLSKYVATIVNTRLLLTHRLPPPQQIRCFRLRAASLFLYTRVLLI